MELTFFATGVAQHVFVAGGGQGEEWVYKIPAAFGEILPLDARLSRYAPRQLHRKFVRTLLLRTSRQRWNVLQRLVTAYYRRERRQRFAAMLDTLGMLQHHGIADVVLPFAVCAAADARLHVGDRITRYRGPVLLQRRADFLTGREGGFERFSWTQLVDRQQRLWRHGFALSDLNEILGPKGWALLGGQIFLADTGSITTDYERAHGCLRPEKLDRRVEHVLRLVEGTPSARLAERYFRFVRQEINQERLAQLWRADLGHVTEEGSGGVRSPAADAWPGPAASDRWRRSLLSSRLPSE